MISQKNPRKLMEENAKDGENIVEPDEIARQEQENNVNRVKQDFDLTHNFRKWFGWTFLLILVIAIPVQIYLIALAIVAKLSSAVIPLSLSITAQIITIICVLFKAKFPKIMTFNNRSE